MIFIFPVHAETFQDEALTVEVEPMSMWLMPNQEKVVEISIKNNLNRSVNIGVFMMFVDCPMYVSGSTDDYFFLLNPGDEKTISFTLKATSCPFNCVDDAPITVAWGENLTMAYEREMDWGTEEGSVNFTIEVQKNFIPQILAAILIIVGIVYYAFYIRKKRQSNYNEKPPKVLD